MHKQWDRVPTTKELLEHLQAELDAICLDPAELDRRIDEVMRLQNFIMKVREGYDRFREGETL